MYHLQLILVTNHVFQKFVRGKAFCAFRKKKSKHGKCSFTQLETFARKFEHFDESMCEGVKIE